MASMVAQKTTLASLTQHCTSIARPAPFRPCRSRQAARCSASRNHQATDLTRRNLSFLLAGLPLLTVPAARALIPDDDDEELIELAKSRRKERLAEEKKTEREYVKAADFKGTDVSAVQKAVNQLAKSGASLDSGDLKALAASIDDSWIGDLKRSVSDLSTSDAAQKSASSLVQTFEKLNASFKGGDLDGAKASFSSAVDALSTWVADVGLASKIKGL